eukprot:SAG11_NODE_2543_length_3237_cov_2.170172_2_plen_126_part_00
MAISSEPECGLLCILLAHILIVHLFVCQISELMHQLGGEIFSLAMLGAGAAAPSSREVREAAAVILLSVKMLAPQQVCSFNSHNVDCSSAGKVTSNSCFSGAFPFLVLTELHRRHNALRWSHCLF